MDFDEIRKRYREFLDWDKDTLDDRVTRMAGEYAYYQNFYIQATEEKNKVETELKEMWQGKWKYYKYEFEVSLDKSEIKGFIEKDLDIIKLQGRLTNYETYRDFFKECMKNIDQMRWDIKTYLDYKKFMAGM